MTFKHLLTNKKAMSKIIAVKNGIERPFSKVAWDLMGKDKNGYVLVPDEVTKQKVQEADNAGAGKDGEKVNPIEDKPKTSEDFTVDGVITKLKGINTIDELNAFAAGETRENYLSLIKRRDAEITEANKPKEEIVGETETVEDTTDAEEMTAEATPDTADSTNEEAETQGDAGAYDYAGPFSNDEGTNVREANDYIDTLETVEAINNYVPFEEDRVTVLKHQAAAVAELK